MLIEAMHQRKVHEQNKAATHKNIQGLERGTPQSHYIVTEVISQRQNILAY